MLFRSVPRDRQAFTWRGAWIQLGSSQALTNAVEKMIWPVSRPWEAATPSSRGKGFMKPEGRRVLWLLPRASPESRGPSARPHQLLAQGGEGLHLGPLPGGESLPCL